MLQVNCPGFSQIQIETLVYAETEKPPQNWGPL